ncbi:MAG: hypothetical protein E7813_09440 [Bradyrhizobium sp.]|uniref:hypothetical protein n=1 Tax=Bradyrhizobium sp. TaxID=376 RepID=UPI001217DD9E|nr:hypothetical protein [Bradyrhizobium sp.]THD70067.1 MAG: hypothetical protein E7813_09440 [Bradyrhizobium sp.]
MRVFVLAGLCLAVAACDQTTQSGASLSEASTDTGAAPPPIYEPLVDMHRVDQNKYRRDLADCRQQAAPQEAVARQARQQEAVGNTMFAAGVIASFIPASTYNQARTLDAASGAGQVVGGTTAASGAATAEQATADYALVVNVCLAHRHYRLLRQ